MSHLVSDDAAAVAAVAQAERLRRAAVLIRRRAGGLTYHPMTGARPSPAPALLAALADVDEVVKDVQRGTDGRAREEAAVSAAGDPRAERLRAGHGAVDQAAQAVLAALEVLRGSLSARDRASVDAPYGHSAPVQYHPGALCTMVAERVEGLVQALETVAVERANLVRTPSDR
jgi:hypothetical protein